MIQQPAANRSNFSWVFVTAAVMSLGWGLRGYIGGGPFGAMIPGALVPLLLCQYLRYDARAAAVVVAFGALGIGFGGEMTYGQTLGLLRASESFAWGLTGTTLKGGVWGVLGGTMLGLGFIARHMAWRHLVLTLAVMLVGILLGLHWIDEPKLVYFSNPIDRPRDESWAGFLLGGLAALAYLRVFQARLAGVPLRFAGYGAVGGAIGFGGGSLLLALQFHVAQSWRWLPYWKFMEFTFGLLFGAALGSCALRMKERLAELGTTAPAADSAASELDARSSGSWLWLARALVGMLVVWGVFRGWRVAERELYAAFGDVPLGGWTETLLRVLAGFAGMGCVLMLLSRRWTSVAWQTAISVTIVAAAVDWQRDLLPRGDIDWPARYRVAFVLAVAAISILFVSVWQSGKRPRLADLFLFAVSGLMVIGYMTGLARTEIWWSDAEAALAAGGRAAYLWQAFRSEIVVHAIFTALFAISLWAAWRESAGTPVTESNAVKP